jgi:hypothetical protein
MGFTQVRKFEDGYGTIGYGLKFMDNPYILVAKEYAYNNLASFIAKLVVDMPSKIDYIFYNNDDEKYTVFDGDYLRAEAEESEGPSKKRDCKWREISLDHGVNLHDYIAGEQNPSTLSGGNEELGAFM